MRLPSIFLYHKIYGNKALVYENAEAKYSDIVSK